MPKKNNQELAGNDAKKNFDLQVSRDVKRNAPLGTHEQSCYFPTPMLAHTMSRARARLDHEHFRPLRPEAINVIGILYCVRDRTENRYHFS